MDKLEGKYFENTIQQLQEVRGAEKIEMRGDFKAELRAGLMGRAVGSVDFDEALPWYVRFKYILAAVPVLAVLTLVVMNFPHGVPAVVVPMVTPQDQQTNVTMVVPTQMAVPADGVARKMNDNAALLDATAPVNQDAMTQETVPADDVPAPAENKMMLKVNASPVANQVEAEYQGDDRAVVEAVVLLEVDGFGKGYELQIYPDKEYLRAMVSVGGELKQMLILAKRDGVWKVVTEYIY